MVVKQYYALSTAIMDPWIQLDEMATCVFRIAKNIQIESLRFVLCFKYPNIYFNQINEWTDGIQLLQIVYMGEDSFASFRAIQRWYCFPRP